MALVPCKECKAEIFVEADKCPRCGVDRPGVSYEEERLEREKHAAEDQLIAEIHRLGERKKAAYARQAELQPDAYPGIIGALLPNKARDVKREKFAELENEIHALRHQMDELEAKVPSSRSSEIDRTLWGPPNPAK